MKLAIISPTKFLIPYTFTDYHLMLAHMSTDYDYMSYYSTVARGYKILDNSVIELGRALHPDELEQAIAALNPHELVLPDTPGSHKDTYEAAQKLGPFFKAKYPDLKLQVVPQAEDGGSVCFMKSMYKFLQIPEVDTIGIPKSLKEERLNVLRLIEADRPTHWDYHLLGTWGNPANELRQVPIDHPWIRGVDSKIPVRLGLHGIALHPTRGMLIPDENRYELPEMKFGSDDDPFPYIVTHNITVMKGWCDGTQSSVRQL